MSEVEKFGEAESLSGDPALVDALIEELVGNPKLAVKLVRTLSMITKPWEPIGNDGNPVNEVAVPEGVNAREFIRRNSATYIRGYRLITIFGNEVATITKSTPKWKIVIEGANQVDSPFVEHGRKAEGNAKAFAEEKLRERGYVIG